MFFPVLRKGWTDKPGGPRMRSGMLPSDKPQYFYFPEDHPTMPSWFKGMEIIIWERRLQPEDGLPAQCPDFKCLADHTDCCCWCLLFNQPDFVGQKSKLQEFIESHGHLCDFYPKYHCELNFIEQYWGVAKFQYRTASRASTLKDMERIVKESLDSVPLLQIWWWVLKFLLYWGLISSLGLQTNLHASFPLMIRVYQVHKQHGQTKNTMGIIHYPPNGFSQLETWMCRYKDLTLY